MKWTYPTSRRELLVRERTRDREGEPLVSVNVKVIYCRMDISAGKELRQYVNANMSVNNCSIIMSGVSVSMSAGDVGKYGKGNA